jgi:hypothetical protein
MYKLIKTKITGFDDIEDSPIGVNSNYRATMGYDSTNETINVKVEKIIRPELTRDEEVEFSYQIVDEKSFTKADFVQTKENMAWQVDFDVQSEKIVAPLDVYAYTSTIATGSLFHRVMWRKIKERYSSDTLLPLFTVDSFYKQAEGFSLSTLQFHVADNPGQISDTVITNSDVEEMTQAEKISYLFDNINTAVFYEVFDADDNLLSTIVPVPCPYPQVAVAAREGDAVRSRGGNQYRTTLPKASSYKVVVFFLRLNHNTTIPCQFDVSCVNGVASKSRVISGLKPGEPTSYRGVNPRGEFTRFSGSEVIKVNVDLESGDFFKLKLSCGDFYSYSELWADIE